MPEAKAARRGADSNRGELAQALGVSPMSVPTGTYDGIRLVVSRVGEIAGCVTGSFQPFIPFVQVVDQPLQPAILTAAPLHRGNLYSNDPITDPAPRTFCTQTAHGELSVGTYTTSPIATNSFFASATMKAGTSYFFTSVFLDSMALAPAAGATIEGYAVDITVNQDSGGTPFVVSEWMTVIRGPDGKVLGGVIVADDDALTIAKGNLDPNASAATGSTRWRVAFRLGSSTGSLEGFTFLPINGTGSCTLIPLQNASIPGGGAYQVSYTRLL